MDEDKVKILDGGFSTQLSQHVGDKVDGDPLWSARFLQTHPDDVIKTHLDFLRAGSDIIMTNTYQASIGGFVKHLNVTPEEGYELIKFAVALAKRARDTFISECPEKSPLIAGSVGPYGAHLNDGSEYSGNYADVTSVDTMRKWHEPRIKALLEAGVDLLAFETIPCQKEADMLVFLLKDYPNVKAWLTLSCKDDKHLANGEVFKTVVMNCWESTDQLVAIGVNCCSPLNAVKLLNSVNDGRQIPIPLITYPNSGELYNVKTGWEEHDKCPPLASYVHQWLKVGACYIGGCCRIQAKDISEIKMEVKKWKDNKLLA